MLGDTQHAIIQDLTYFDVAMHEAHHLVSELV